MPALLVPYKPLFLCCLEFCSQLWANDVFKLIGRDGDLIAVCVHLNQLEVAAMEISIKEILIKLEHSQLCQLIYRDSDYPAIHCDTGFPAFQFIRLPKLF